MIICFSLSSFAGYDEGIAAFEKKDYVTAFKELLPVANSGNAQAQYYVSRLYTAGQGVEKDKKEAFRLLALSAQQGVQESEYMLALYYLGGIEVPLDKKEPIRLLTHSANRGYIPSQFQLGEIYRIGLYAPQDFKKSLKWYRLAAEYEEPAALMALSEMYFEGKGVQKNGIEAVRLLRILADKGDPNGQVLLGLTYEYGEPEVPKNIDDALKWYRLAASQNNETAREAIERINTERRDEELFPSIPAQITGVVSCNTRCQNAACWRTYDNGNKVRFQAKRVFDTFTNQFKFEAGNC